MAGVDARVLYPEFAVLGGWDFGIGIPSWRLSCCSHLPPSAPSKSQTWLRVREGTSQWNQHWTEKMKTISSEVKRSPLADPFRWLGHEWVRLVSRNPLFEVPSWRLQSHSIAMQVVHRGLHGFSWNCEFPSQFARKIKNYVIGVSKKHDLNQNRCSFWTSIAENEWDVRRDLCVG